MAYTEQDCIDAMREAAERLGKDFTSDDFRDTNISPSSRTIQVKCGSWNEAREAAGLAPKISGGGYCSVPSIIDMCQEEWESLTVNRRTDLSRYSILWRIKEEVGCKNCGYSENALALEFHHKNPNEKLYAVSSYGAGQITWEEAKDELKKCEILCSNCHRIETCKIDLI